MLMPTKILVPTDFSEYSDKALEQAIDIARQYRAEVFVLHVIHEEPLLANFDYVPPRELNLQIKEQAEIDATERIQKQLEKFPRAKEVVVVGEIRRGVTYDEILKESKDKQIDLIVIASLGRTGLAHYLIGSTARNVLRGSKCPVLLTK